jgi:hypothetical protein
LSTAVLAGGILFIAGILMAGLTHSVLQLAAHDHQTSIAQTLNFIDSNNELPFLFGAAVTALAAGLSIVCGSNLPKWLGWLSIVIGIVCVAGPISFFGLIAFAIWLPVSGFVISVKAKNAPITAAQ